ncbi:hypothetical protein DFH07DRAFT_778531 [Mycena maculata]|uniref:Uncharacterized protein n=1 Tax=Mycena maculata TaxID=230809 RepID=A0AAD7ICL1_9AGAR|nr:hypothetical protein DFH07DRAFT_778531 [Mycena maculata]
MAITPDQTQQGLSEFPGFADVENLKGPGYSPTPAQETSPSLTRDTPVSDNRSEVFLEYQQQKGLEGQYLTFGYYRSWSGVHVYWPGSAKQTQEDRIGELRVGLAHRLMQVVIQREIKWSASQAFLPIVSDIKDWKSFISMDVAIDTNLKLFSGARIRDYEELHTPGDHFLKPEACCLSERPDLALLPEIRQILAFLIQKYSE